ncbi:hypothetical protein N7468_002684 [Penicillium chermesinum]|uniref:Uncharacterized protein n=1 Tax=Penicillium chermesinum TaxID=63820 RepID=A0A9W9TXS2_9EURO|nr:uncharacterized protein N7468_002684 [Penicillium chermesinum]KAJ5247701.1 hypothetical protein N7468_002684 [Penicillium chermesinum]KAJ6151465.1 hypothetical protein N7470_007062 [Penicillium chermesinum]
MSFFGGNGFTGGQAASSTEAQPNAQGAGLNLPLDTAVVSQRSNIFQIEDYDHPGTTHTFNTREDFQKWMSSDPEAAWRSIRYKIRRAEAMHTIAEKTTEIIQCEHQLHQMKGEVERIRKDLDALNDDRTGKLGDSDHGALRSETLEPPISQPVASHQAFGPSVLGKRHDHEFSVAPLSNEMSSSSKKNRMSGKMSPSGSARVRAYKRALADLALD